MGRILAIDHGKKRCGIAVTDPMRMIGSPLTTVDTEKVFEFLHDYFQKETVDLLLVGYPTNIQGEATDATPLVDRFIEQCRKKFPSLELRTWDESFSSRKAMQTLVQSGVKKKDRRQKGALDQVSAAVILQEYLQNL
ncbi:MAG TPA: Holliday junction resolvase RuvX [Chitinophagales bacterium]|nr:Holliday junction resolvase RuvX [Chitinophagales bacterium]HAE13220.1 Holliday junction resolvase RuvX [Bacteroidota bacterium]MCB9031587.1 Holliday junction resolvase RuvX [Chitinophagales bacterium]HAE35192.1 Holliday junction resolvase RuvX [Bacteroidota bacterium]HPE98237.1 Holliday junction resolvase RuvX [Chitinophagales bacterium]